jgi:hypothetical protein
MGVLRNQIGAEALDAVIEHLPTQYTKCYRAGRVTTLFSFYQTSTRPTQ